MINPAKEPWVYVQSRYQPCQARAGRAFGRVWNQTDLFFPSKPGLLASYPDPLLTLGMRMTLSLMLLLECTGKPAGSLPLSTTKSILQSMFGCMLENILGGILQAYSECTSKHQSSIVNSIPSCRTGGCHWAQLGASWRACLGVYL